MFLKHGLAKQRTCITVTQQNVQVAREFQDLKQAVLKDLHPRGQLGALQKRQCNHGSVVALVWEWQAKASAILGGSMLQTCQQEL